MAKLTNEAVVPPKIGERTRAGLLQAALEEFSVRGFDAATIRAISARAGLSHGMVRYYYDTKEKLWFATVVFLFERQGRELRYTEEELEAGKRGDKFELLRIWLRKYVRYCARHPEHARIIMQESVSPSPRLKEVIKSHLDTGSHQRVREQMKGYVEQGLFPRTVPLESIIYIITGACQNIFTLAPEAQLFFDYDAMSDEAIEAHAEAIVEMFCPPSKTVAA